MKKVMKKILKCLIVLLIVFIIYVVICFFQSKALVVELTDAMYRDDIEKIYELTGKDFTFVEIGDEKEKQSIYDILADEEISYIIGEDRLNSFSYEIKGVKPVLQGFSYEVEITVSDYEKICDSGENLNKYLDNEYRELCIKQIQSSIINNDYDFEKVRRLASTAIEYVYLDDIEYEKYGTIQIPINLVYNIYTRKFIEPGEFYGIAKGGYHVPLAFVIFGNEYVKINSQKDVIDFYNKSGDFYLAEFYNDIFLGISCSSGDVEGGYYCFEKNKYFIENNFPKDAVIESLSGDGYIFPETLDFISIDDGISVDFYNNNCIYPDYLKDIPKEEVIEKLKEEGYYLGNELYFEKDNTSLKVFFYENELIWLTNRYSSNISEEVKNLVKYIIKNNLKRDEIIEFLVNEGYTQVEE